MHSPNCRLASSIDDKRKRHQRSTLLLLPDETQSQQDPREVNIGMPLDAIFILYSTLELIGVRLVREELCQYHFGLCLCYSDCCWAVCPRGVYPFNLLVQALFIYRIVCVSTSTV